MNFKVIVRDLRMWWRSYGLQVCAVLAWLIVLPIISHLTFPLSEESQLIWGSIVLILSCAWLLIVVPKLPASLKNLRRRKPGKSSRQRTMAH